MQKNSSNTIQPISGGIRGYGVSGIYVLMLGDWLFLF